MKPIYAEVYEQGVEKGYEVANVKTYYDENGQAKIETIVHTPYYDENGRRVIGSGTVNATHGKGLREVADVDLLFDDDGQMSLFDENGNAVDKETMKTEMSQYMSAASEYPHVASYDEWYDNQKHNYEKVKLDAEPTKSDYVKYLDNVSRQMASGDIKFVGPISTQQDFVKYLDNMSMAGADIKASNPQIKNSYDDRIQMVTSNLQSASGIAGWNNHTNSKDRKVNGVDIAQVKIYGDTFTFDDGMLVSKDNQQIKNSYDDVYEQGVAKGYEISSVRTASIDAGQRDVLGYGESAVISMKTPYFDSKGSAVTGLASVPLVKDAERQSNTVEFLVNGYNMDYILGGDRKLYTNTGAQVNVEQARQEMGQFAAAGSNYPHVSFFEEWKAEQDRKNNEIGLERVSGADVPLYLVYLDYMANKMNNGQRFVGDIQTINDFGKAQESIKLYMVLHPDYAQEADYTGKTNSNKIDEYLAKVRDNSGMDALKSDDVVYDPVMSMKKDFLKNILDNMRKEGTFTKDKTQEKSEHVKMITPQEAKTQEQQAESVMHVDNINDYVLDLVQNGAKVYSGKKTATVHAEQGVIGDVITTDIDKTENTVGVDEFGNPDWVITNSGGEKYVVKDKVFKDTYEQAGDEPGVYSKKALQLLVPCEKSVEFTPPWGGSFTVEKGGYFTVNGYNDIAGVQKEAFEQTYKIVSQSYDDVKKAFSVLTNGEKSEPELTTTNLAKDVSPDLVQMTMSNLEIAFGGQNKNGIDIAPLHIPPLAESISAEDMWSGKKLQPVLDVDSIHEISKTTESFGREKLNPILEDMGSSVSSGKLQIATPNLQSNFGPKPLPPVLDVDKIVRPPMVTSNLQSVSNSFLDVDKIVRPPKTQKGDFDGIKPGILKNEPKPLPPVLDVDKIVRPPMVTSNLQSASNSFLDVDKIVHPPKTQEGDFDGNKVGVLKADSNSRKLPENGEALLSALENNGHDGHGGLE